MSPLSISVIGAAAVWDFLHKVEALPNTGGHARVLGDCAEPQLGGCAPNIAIGIRKLLGCAVRLCYPVGKDAARALASWRAAGLECSGVEIVEGANSGKAFLFVQPDGASMCFAHAGAAEAPPPAVLPELGDWVVIAPRLNAYTLPFLEKALREERHVVMTGIASPEVIAYLPRLEALVMSDSEAAEALGSGSFGELSAGCGRTAFFVTRGRRGSEVWQEGRRTEISAIPADAAIDVTGAGDAYCAGVVAALARGSQPEDAALLGAACASIVVESYGGQSGIADLQAAFRRLGRGAPAALARLQDRWTKSL